MKRFGLALSVVCLAALAVTGVATAKDGNDRDSVVGAIKRTYLDGTGKVHFVIGAHETRDGASGHVHASYDDRFYGKTSYTGRVTCVRAVRHSAMVGIEIVKSDRPGYALGSGVLLRVTDYGEPSTGGQRDSISPAPVTATPPAACPAPVKVTSPTYGGNVQVHDGDS